MFRVLLVDDYEPFRAVVRSILRSREHLQAVGESSGGLEAIQKVIELQPDLVLLDVGLQGLNGIEVGKRLRYLVPRARVLFLTIESSSDVTRKALDLGAIGYVNKLRTGSELLAAIEAARAGRRFVGAGFERVRRE